ncbi:SEC14-like protein 2 [Araneus ventricosus]|uniref:SEC14-like protein 2 n=1 Tax=Araneus ventricosus TaxID=182803 RepID=A0A4Y2GJL3_ARAVE|nr:SEC14-like protein 2 [Araneus ventricosus]
MFLKTFQDNYPERIKFVFHINASVYYTTTMSVMKVFMATPLLQKIKAFGSEGWREALLEQIDAEVLPAFLGGKRTDPDGDPLCKSFVVHGQKVPEKYFFTNCEKKLSKAPDAKKVTVTRFSKEEVRLDVRLPGSFLEWEFETKSKDIGFGVFFKAGDARPVELVPKQRIDTCYGPERGLFKCLKAGTYTIVFDNSFSWMHPKEIYYRIRIRNPDEAED